MYMFKRKQLILILFEVLFTSIFVSCGNGVNNSPEEGSKENLSEVYAKLGNVHKIYQAASIARCFTGQKIQNCFGCQEVVFTGVLVEYDSLDETVVKYVENLPNRNAAVHQHYPNVIYDENEIYVEFATYTDNIKQETICHEIRIFQGDFIKNFNGSAYAKSVTFDPSLTIDLDRMKNIKTGEPVEYVSEYTFTNRAEVCKSIKEYPEEFSKYGTISEVYLTVNQYDEILKRDQNNQQYYITYYVEYSSLNEVTMQFYNNRKDDYTFSWSSSDFYIDSKMKYIKFKFIFDKDTDKKVSGSAWIFDPNDFPELTYGVLITACTYFFDEYPDLYTLMAYLAPSKYKEVDSSVYPAELSKFGTLEKVFAYVFEDGTIANDCITCGDYPSTFIAQYSNFNATTKAFFKKLPEGCYWRDHSATYKPEKYYIEYMNRNFTDDYFDKEQFDLIECNFYDPEQPECTHCLSDESAVAKGEYEDFYAYCESLVAD